MAGFFSRFGKKDKEDYFLEQDDAQTFGNAEFMRRPQEVKKTFPKMGGGKAVTPPKITPKSSFDTPKSSASTSTNGSFSTPSFNNNFEPPKSSASTSTNGSVSTPSFNNGETSTASPSERRKADTSMDMFRDMAKNMRR
ncbi:MAG: hypothetical protein WBA77_07985 [Microcoleaceae cyanobacterium]